MGESWTRSISNYLLTMSEVVTGKSQTEALLYWPSKSEVNTVGRGLRFSRNNRTVKIIKLFIVWLIKEKKKIIRAEVINLRLAMRSKPKTLTPGPRTRTMDRVCGLLMDQSTDYPYGPSPLGHPSK